MNKRLELAIKLALEAGALQLQSFGKGREIETKSSSIDLVTDVDRACDALLVERISVAFPEDGILSEEGGGARSSANGYRWVIDPLDGTTNYAHGLPHFAVSIGVELKGLCLSGAIYDPIREELFTALRGSGARLNDAPIQVSRTESLERALLATGFAYDVHTAEIRNLDYLGRFLRRARAVRRTGSAALDLAYVACGRFDGFWELRLEPWDVSAGMLLIEEAGGALSDVDGSPPPASGERLVASNGLVHPELIEVLR